MQRYFIFSLLFATLIAAPCITFASGDPYANEVVDEDGYGIADPEAMLGEPDDETGIMAALNSYIVLDMGEDEEGTDNLLLHMGPLSLTGLLQIRFLGEDFSTISTHNMTMEPLATSAIYNIPFSNSEPYRYVQIISLASFGLFIDALEATDYVGA